MKNSLLFLRCYPQTHFQISPQRYLTERSCIIKLNTFMCSGDLYARGYKFLREVSCSGSECTDV